MNHSTPGGFARPPGTFSSVPRFRPDATFGLGFAAGVAYLMRPQNLARSYPLPRHRRYQPGSAFGTTPSRPDRGSSSIAPSPLTGALAGTVGWGLRRIGHLSETAS
jgi:hypothetical protein